MNERHIPQASTQCVWEFDRYVRGELKAEGIRITREKTLAGARAAAASLASPGDVLILRASGETAADPTESDPAIFARAVVAGVARWEFFSGSEDAGEVCVGGLRYATKLFAGTPILGPLLRESLERHTCWKKGAVKSAAPPAADSAGEQST